MKDESDKPRSTLHKLWRSFFGQTEIQTGSGVNPSLKPDEMVHARLQEARRLANQDEPAQFKFNLRKGPNYLPKRADYIFPPLSLLVPPQARQAESAEFHQQRAEQLVQMLSELGVEAQYGDIYTGPMITRYEVFPAPGVLIEKIVSLEHTMSQALKADGLRVVASIPGKRTVGIEIPNRKPTGVCLREIIESKAWNESRAEIPITLGKDVMGKPVVVDLTKMPHLLIAGAPGTGKTVCINSIIASLLLKMTPEDIRFIMIDPTTVEMQRYNSLPHMVIPIVLHPNYASATLNVLLQKMRQRFKMFAQEGVSNIASFNAKMLKAGELDADLSPDERANSHVGLTRRSRPIEYERRKLPYIVCIINELADLMMFAPSEIETCIAQLVQHARAAGIHLIIATQRPLLNVITGVIKANIPCRIAFKVVSKTDSRTILDLGGADTLIGRGDMLFVPPGEVNLVRAQGAFVSDEEMNQLVEFLAMNGEPEYDGAKTWFGEDTEEDEENAEDNDEWDDRLVPQAIDVMKATKRASTSMLQRRLKIGYNRAARIMEILEMDGVVGPENGSEPREILKDLDSL